MLINQFVPPTFCLFFAFSGMNFRGLLHHVCDVAMTKTFVDQSELVNIGAQIDNLTICKKWIAIFKELE